MSDKVSCKANAKKMRSFKIENNMLIGNELVFPEETLNVGEILLGVFKSRPEFVGLVDSVTGKECTYGELWEQCVRCAVWLRKQGLKRGDTIAFCSDNTLSSYVPLIASFCVGTIFAPDIHEQNLYLARRHLSTTNPKVIFIEGRYAPIMEAVAKELNMKLKIVLFDDTSDVYDTLNEIMAQQSESEVQDFRCVKITDPKEIAILLKTSGTTGMPKYAELTHIGMKIVAHPSRSKGIANKIVVCGIPLGWLYGIAITFPAIYNFAKRIIVRDNDSVEPYCKVIDKYKAEHFSAEPSMLMQLMKTDLLKRYSLASLKVIIVAGSCFKREQQEAFSKLLPNARVIQLYGSTDAGDGYVYQNENSNFGSCGFVLEGTKVKIVDLETEKPLGCNERGEIRVHGPHMLTRYYKNPEATRKAFDSDGWLRTGDIGYYDERGEIYVVDRISHFIKYRSYPLSSAEIESVLEMNPSIYESAVIPVPHEIDGQRPMAIIAKVPNKQITEQEVKDQIAKHLPQYCQLRGGVIFVDKLPRTVTGKVIKSKLVEMHRDGLL